MRIDLPQGRAGLSVSHIGGACASEMRMDSFAATSTKETFEMTRTWTKAAVAAVFAITSTLVLAADAAPDATMEFSGGSVAVGVGVNWGHGTLHYQGKTYSFRMNGLNIADIGAQGIKGTGEIYHLAKVEDFNGTYGAASAGATLASTGAGATAMENSNGVVIRFLSDSEGLELTAAVGGVAIQLEGAQQ